MSAPAMTIALVADNPHGVSRPHRVAPLLACCALVALLGPWLFSAYWLNTFTTVACLTLVAGAVALLYGQLGMVSLAQFALSGVGGWVCLRLAHGFALPFEAALLAGGLVAAVFGLVTGLPALRMRGLYLALLTLMIAAAFQVVINVIGFPDGGPGFTGKVVNSQRSLIERPWLAHGDEAYFRYVMSWLAGGLALIEWQRGSLPGRAWALIRKGEAGAIAAGVSVLRYKAWAFAFGGFLAGIAGGLIAGLNGQLDNTGFLASQSILVYALTVVGGAYHWMGAVFAGLLLRALPALLNDHGVDGNLANAFYGIALLLSLIQGRSGIAGQLADVYRDMRASRIAEGCATWSIIAAGIGGAAHANGSASFAGAAFIVLAALLLRLAIPGICWLLLGFFGQRVRRSAEHLDAALSTGLANLSTRYGLTPDFRLPKRSASTLVACAGIAGVASSVFDLPFATGAAISALAIAAKVILEVAIHPWILPIRHAIDSRCSRASSVHRREAP